MNLFDLKFGPAAVDASPIFGALPYFGNGYPNMMNQPLNAGSMHPSFSPPNIFSPFAALFHGIGNLLDPTPGYAQMLADLERKQSHPKQNQQNQQNTDQVTDDNSRVLVRRLAARRAVAQRLAATRRASAARRLSAARKTTTARRVSAARSQPVGKGPAQKRPAQSG